MNKRKALLVGNSTYNDGANFAELSTPTNDANDFAEALKNFGDFEIVSVIENQTVDIVRYKCDEFFSDAEKGDLLLFYFSGHGHKDKELSFYLAVKDTLANRLLSTALTEGFLREAIHKSRSKHIVVILDCCFSGTLGEGEKSGGENSSVIFEKLSGETTAILASSSSIQFSFQSQRNSLFTQHLIGGIIGGLADEDNDGLIAVDELFRYAERKVRENRPEQSPSLFIRALEARLIIAKNPKQNFAQKIPDLIKQKNQYFVGIKEKRAELLSGLEKVEKFLTYVANCVRVKADLDDRRMTTKLLAKPHVGSGGGWAILIDVLVGASIVYFNEKKFAGIEIEMVSKIYGDSEQVINILQSVSDTVAKFGLEENEKQKDIQESITFLNDFCPKVKADPLKILQETNVDQLEKCKTNIQKFAGKIEAWEIFDEHLEE